MDLEVVNISKIKDGFFIGDEFIASNLDIIIQFKISHMINAAGLQVINAWESIGVRYLTLNWNEAPSQNLFDQKYEIANRIVSFIDDCSKNGEGILIHSKKGQNRACIVTIIYFMKKYRWSLSKTIEFLKSKKFDVNITKYFLNQLSIFESHLTKIGYGPKSSTWEENDITTHDTDEKLLRNTYINGILNLKQNTNDFNELKRFQISGHTKKLRWSDNNSNYRKDLLCSYNLSKDLLNQKEIKPVTTHKKLKPKKSCLKTINPSSIAQETDKSMNKSKIEEEKEKEKNEKRQLVIKANSSEIQEKKHYQIDAAESVDANKDSHFVNSINNFNNQRENKDDIKKELPKEKERDNVKEGSLKEGQRDLKEQLRESIKKESLKDSQREHHGNQNIGKGIQGHNQGHGQGHGQGIQGQGNNQILSVASKARPASVEAKKNSDKNLNMINTKDYFSNNATNNYIQNPNINPYMSYNSGNDEKDNMRPMSNQVNYHNNPNQNNMPTIINNNYLNFYIQAPDSESERKENSKDNSNKCYNNYLNQGGNNNTINYKNIGNDFNPFKTINGLQSNNMTFNKNVPVNKNGYINALPSTSKKAQFSGNPTFSNSIKIPNLNIVQKNTQKAIGPVKITHGIDGKKSEQLINNLSTIKYKQPGTLGGSIVQKFGKSSLNDTIKRSSSSRHKNEDGSTRPATAPSKPDKKNSDRSVGQNGSNKRLPSPNIQSSNYGSNKHPVAVLPSYGKRQPSPQTKSTLSSTLRPVSKNYLNN